MNIINIILNIILFNKYILYYNYIYNTNLLKQRIQYYNNYYNNTKALGFDNTI